MDGVVHRGWVFGDQGTPIADPLPADCVRRDPHARAYALGVTTPDGASKAHTTRKSRLKLGRLRKTGPVTVSIVAVSADGRIGPAIKRRFKRSK